MKNDMDALIKAWDWSEIAGRDRAVERFTRRISDLFAVAAAISIAVFYYHSDLSPASFLATGTLATIAAGYLGKNFAMLIYQRLNP